MSVPGFAWFVPFFNGLFLGLLAMAVHEAGHIVMARSVGIKIRRVGFGWKGMYTVREAGPPAKNMLVSFAGPLVNLLLILCWPWWPIFGLANFCCGIANLLPIQGSDGDRMLQCWREMRNAGKQASPSSERPSKAA
jgi:Zn-dependent protease